MKEVHLVLQEDPQVAILVGATRATHIHSIEDRDHPDPLLDMEEQGATQEAILAIQEHLATHQEIEDQHLPDRDQDIPHRATQDTDLLALLVTILHLLEHQVIILAMVPIQENIHLQTSQLLDRVNQDQDLMVTIHLLPLANMRDLLLPPGPLLYTTDLILRDHLELRHLMRWSREVTQEVKMVDRRAQNLA